jgi:ABC-2 type transport system permease protein
VGARLIDSLSKERLGAGESAISRYNFTVVTVAPARVTAARDSLLPEVDRRDENDKRLPSALTGLLIVSDSGLALGRLTYVGSNVSSLGDIGHMEHALQTAMVRERVLGFGLSDSIAGIVTAPAELTTAKVTKGTISGEGSEAAFMFSYILVILLFVALMPTGIQVMSAVVEEKSNRILEVLISSVRPFDLMLGKILGVGAASILQIAIWGASASLLGRIGGRGMGSMQASAGGGAAAIFKMPNIPVSLILVVILYFSLGFLFFTTAYAAVGAMCNTVQETQQVAFPVTGMIMAGYIGSFLAIARPETMMAKVMTYLPFTAPFIVPTRWSNAPLPLTELLGSIGICVLGVVGMVWLAARIYRVGILSYGKKPSFKDIWVWIRAS